MPVSLPEGVLPSIRSRSSDKVLVDNERISHWDFEVLDKDQNHLGWLIGVESDSGSLEISASASVKGSGSITVRDVDDPEGPRHWDWTMCRIKPWCTIDGIADPYPFGVWIPSVPQESWTDKGRAWTVELLDRVSILDQDVYTDPATGNLRASFAKGTNVISIIRQIIADTGETSEAIENDPSAVLTVDKTYDAGTTKLQVVNDLLDGINYFSIYSDYEGRYRCDKYTAPTSRPLRYEAVGPFEAGETSIYSPEFTIDRDIFSIPNRVVGITTGDGDTEGLTSIAVNLDPSSPYSQPNRGRWITKILTDIDGMTQASLDAYVQRNLQTSMSVASSIPLQHVLLPDLAVNQAVAIRNPEASIDIRAVVSKLTINMDPTALCTTDFTEIIS